MHCDIEVFEWLMSFISKQNPKLEPRLAVSLLISSNFLKMPTLRDICLDYIHDNIEDVVKVPVDMQCINPDLMKRLSSRFTLPYLTAAKDPKDRIKSQIFRHKLHDMLFSQNEAAKTENSLQNNPQQSLGKGELSDALPGQQKYDPLRQVFHHSSIRQCSTCQEWYSHHSPLLSSQQLYHWSSHVLENCPAAQSKDDFQLDFWGRLSAPHVPMPAVSLDKYISHVYTASRNDW